MENVAIGVDDIDGLAKFAKGNGIDLTVVGPEGPLVAGVTDRFRKDGLRIFGPTAAAAELEGSKSFTKDFLSRHNIPTAKYETFTDEEKAVAYIEKHGAPVVVKADGLAAGKGVIVAMDTETAVSAARDMLSGNKFGSAGSRIVVEDYLDGEEASFIVMTDGVNILPMATSQDHKRVTASIFCRWPPARTTSASATETPAPTPAEWAPTPLPRSSPRTSMRRSCPASSPRPSAEWQARDANTSASSTPAS